MDRWPNSPEERKLAATATGSSVRLRYSFPTPGCPTSAAAAASNRLTIGLSIHYENTKDPELGFDRNFTRFADYSSDLDLLQVEDALVEDIGAQLSQDIFNASLGNW